jgi:fumarylacetoacetate (FAA) hydrolase family protein
MVLTKKLVWLKSSKLLKLFDSRLENGSCGFGNFVKESDRVYGIDSIDIEQHAKSDSLSFKDRL